MLEGLDLCLGCSYTLQTPPEDPKAILGSWEWMSHAISTPNSHKLR